MERTQPHSRPYLASAIQNTPHSHSMGKSDRPWTIIAWDPQKSRYPLINGILAACGAQPRWFEEVTAVQQAELSRCCCLAVVALGACPSPGDYSLEVVRSLKSQGFRVICYGEGAQAWPLVTRCHVLLAGSSWLLDCAGSEFTPELRRVLGQLLRAEASRQDEEEQIKGAMKRLGIIGESPSIISVFRAILRASAASDLPVLITGETGTGKELLAHVIYQLDRKRCNGPFVALNCGAISPGIAESELFGHRRGAFSGADRDRKGLIRSAEGGVLFLDEIGELDGGMQAKLLRVLQEKRVLAVGEDHEVSVDVRIIAATNRDLDQMVQQKRFRADLFHRLNVLSIYIPPLRGRPADIKPLIEHFVEKYRFLKPAGSPMVAPDFIEALIQVELPGNARQLENLVRRALVNKNDDTPLNLSDLPPELWQQLSEQGQSLLAQPETASEGKDIHKSSQQNLQHHMPSDLMGLLDANGWSLSRSLQHCERLLLEAALRLTHGNQSQTAQLLGITPRSVYNKVHKHQLHR
jgi:transcriptional regulator with PAS, ATPase and Fis domain